MDTERDRPKLKFPLWKYLSQPLFSPEFRSLNPLRFWHLYNAEQLEDCWTKHTLEPVYVENSVQFLEICWLKTDVGIGLVQSLQVVEFLEDCWDKEFSQNPLPDRHNDSPEYFDESEDYY